MITTAATLERAWLRWRFLQRDPAVFELVVSVLDDAICQSDVDFALALPDFLVRKLPADRNLYEILTEGEVLVAYRLTERYLGAEVEILP